MHCLSILACIVFLVGCTDPSDTPRNAVSTPSPPPAPAAPLAAPIVPSSTAPPVPPTIDRFEPSRGAPGSLVTVFGSGFAGHVDVFFGGARAHPFDVPALTALDHFEIAVPDDARPGPIAVLVSTSRGGAAAVTSIGAFEVLGERPHAEWRPAAVGYCVVYAPDCTVVPDAFHQYGCWLAHLDVLCTYPEPVRRRRPSPD